MGIDAISAGGPAGALARIREIENRFNSAAAFGATMSTVSAAQGTLNANGVPADLMVYGNGQIPLDKLSPLSGSPGKYLWAPAANQFEAMKADAARAGVTIGVTDAYRNLSQQQELVDKVGLQSDGGLAAPAGKSTHGWGVSLDLQLNDAGLAWMRANGAKYGYAENVAGESWHWTYKG